jgi:E3 ubiquitin-protein ligase UHRF1
MQDDTSGTYRPNNQTTGTASSTGWNLFSSEASAVDHYGHPDNCIVGQIFESRCVDFPQWTEGIILISMV